MRRNLTIALLAAVLGFSTTYSFAQPQSETQPRNSPVIEHWLKIVHGMAKQQTIAATEAPFTEFKLREKAVFRHTQPLRGDDIGAVYVWTSQNERPAAIGVFFAWSQGNSRWVMQEFHSLHSGPIQKTMTGKKTWSSKVAGFEWEEMTAVPPPHKDTRKHPFQAKQIPRKLKVIAAKSKKERHPLRVVPKPFYEYADAENGIEYGAIYGFCQGTDTELIVLVESRNENNKRKWVYGLAPFTDYQLEVTRPDNSVWKSPAGELGENGKPHYWDWLELIEKPAFEKSNQN